MSASSAHVKPTAASVCHDGPKHVRDDDSEHGRERLDDGIARRDPEAAARAAAAEQHEAQHGNVVLRRDSLAAARAGRRRPSEIEAPRARVRRHLDGLGFGLVELRAQVALHHDREPIGDDVEEAADDQAEQADHDEQRERPDLEYFHGAGLGRDAEPVLSPRSAADASARRSGTSAAREPRAAARRPRPS